MPSADRVTAAFHAGSEGAVVVVASLLVLGSLLLFPLLLLLRLPGAFVPDEDKGAFMVDIQLPDGASLERTEAVTREVSEIMKADPDVDHVMTVYGYSMLKGIATSNGAFSIAVLKPWDERPEPSQHQAAVLQRLQGQLLAIPSALVMAFSPPPMNMRTLGPLSP